MFDGVGTPEARYWLARHKIRSEFGLTAEEADREDATEVAIHLTIWEQIAKRQKWESERASKRRPGPS